MTNRPSFDSIAAITGIGEGQQALYMSVLNIPERALPTYVQEVEYLSEVMKTQMSGVQYTVAPPWAKRYILYVLRVSAIYGQCEELTDEAMAIMFNAGKLNDELLAFSNQDEGIAELIQSKFEAGDIETAKAIWQEHKPQVD